MFGAILSYIRRQVGLRTDAASSTGTVHAKTAAIVEDTAVIGTSADDRADNSVMGHLNTQVKSWQRVTGTTAATSADKVLSLTSVNPAKCMVFVEGTRFALWAVGELSYPIVMPHYVSAFTADSITLTVSGATGVVSYVAGTVSVIIIELY